MGLPPLFGISYDNFDHLLIKYQFYILDIWASDVWLKASYPL